VARKIASRRFGLLLAGPVASCLALFAVVTGGVTPAFASCPNVGTQGGGGFWFDGGYQNTPSNLSSVSGSLDYYNPGPVWTGSADWVMMTNQSGREDYAQTGIVHQATVSTQLLVFWEDCNQPYVCRDPVFKNAVNPGETENVSVLGDGTSGWVFCWNESCQTESNTSFDFGPDKIDVYGEIHDYSAPSDGSHAMGDVNTTAGIRSVQWGDTSSNLYNASLYYDLQGGSGQSADFQDLIGYPNLPPGNNFQIYDSRYTCTDAT